MARTARGADGADGAPGGLSSGAPPLPGGADASDAAAAARTFEASRGLVGATLKGGAERRLVDAPEAAAEFDAEVDNPLALGELRSMALMRIGEKNDSGKESAPASTTAVLALYNKRLGGKAAPFSDSDHRTLSVYSRLCSSVHAYIETIREMQAKLRASSSVIDVAMNLTANLQGRNLYHNITSLARHLVPSDWSTLYLVEESATSARSLMAVRQDGLPGVIVKQGVGAAGSVAQTLVNAVVRSPETDPRFEAGHYGDDAGKVREVLALPLTDSHGTLKGVLELCNRQAAPSFNRSDEATLKPFCDLAGISLHNSRMLQVAQRTGTETHALQRRGSMIGVRRSPGGETPSGGGSGGGGRGGGGGRRAGLLGGASVDHLQAATNAAAAVELELISQRKLRASVFSGRRISKDDEQDASNKA